MTIADEKELVDKAREDPREFGVLFEHYYDKIFGYAYGRLLDFDAAKDVTSEVFFKAYKNFPRFRWRGISISAWFYRIATNEINGFLRRKRRAPNSLQRLMEESGFETNLLKYESPEQAAHKQLEQFHDFQIVQSKLTTLPVKYQEVIALKYFEGKRIQEICKILKKKEGTVKSLLSRGLDKLRALM